MPQRPLASFVFDAQKVFYDARYKAMSLAQLGRFFTRVCEAVDRKDVAFLRPIQDAGMIGRVYFRDARRPAIPIPIRRSVLERDGYACRRCGSQDSIEIDHVHPFSKGGTDQVDNLQALCKPCNRTKGASC